MKRLLVITDSPRTEATVHFALSLLGVPHDVVRSLAEAVARLDRESYRATLVDLHWGRSAAASLSSWTHAHLVARDLRVILTACTPLWWDMRCCAPLPAATYLRRNFDLLDLKEAVVGAA